MPPPRRLRRQTRGRVGWMPLRLSTCGSAGTCFSLLTLWSVVIAAQIAPSQYLTAATFNGMAFGAPAQHPAGEIGDIGEAGLAQDHGGLRRAAAGPAHGDDRAVACQLTGAFGQLAERDQDRLANVSQRSPELIGLPHVEDLNALGMLLETVRVDLPDAGEGVFEMRPAWLRRDIGVCLRLAAFEVGRHRDIHLLRMRQPQILHVAGEIAFADLAPQTRIEAALLTNTGDGQPAIVVGGIEQARIGQAEDLLAHGAEHGTRITLLEVGAPAASDHQTIPGESHAAIVEHICQTTAGVARCRPDLEV